MEFEELKIQPVDFKNHLETCIRFREDSFIVSFGSADRFYEEDGKGGERYIDRLKQKYEQDPESVVHIWHGNEIIGQMELGQFRIDPSRGYVNLYYLVPEQRGRGYSASLEKYTEYYMKMKNYKLARLSVSPSNKRAFSFYLKNGWRDLGPRPGRPEMHFMEKCFSTNDQKQLHGCD